jgi:hypothetical protein
MKDSLVRKVEIPKAGRRKVYYDTQKVEKDTAKINFFPASADRDVPKANYISNPFPGDNARLIYGLTFALTSQFIQTDSDNNIDAEGIINNIKDAGVIANADQDYKEFLRVPLSDHFDFSGTHLSIATALAGQAAKDDQESTVDKTVTLEDHGLYRLADPFVVAPTQNLNLYVEFNDAYSFTSADDWDNAGQQPLYMQCRLQVAELTPAMQAR